MGKNKAPGPDTTGPYIFNKNIYKEMIKNIYITSEAKIIFKKSDPGDIKNNNPLTNKSTL